MAALNPMRRRPCRRGDEGFESLLRNCEGFRAFSPDGRLGTVVHQLYGSDGELDSLRVRTGLFRRRLVTVRTDDIEWMIPESRSILLREQVAAVSE